MTTEQEQLKAKHGTPEEFALACIKASKDTITPAEAGAAIAKYNDEWKRAGGQACCWEIVAPASICGKTADWQTNGKWFCRDHQDALLMAGKRFAEIVVNKDKINAGRLERNVNPNTIRDAVAKALCKGPSCTWDALTKLELGECSRGHVLETIRGEVELVIAEILVREGPVCPRCHERIEETFRGEWKCWCLSGMPPRKEQNSEAQHRD